MKKFLLFVFIVIQSVCRNCIAAEESIISEEVKAILQHCYQETDKTIVDSEMQEVLISEINCKKML